MFALVALLPQAITIAAEKTVDFSRDVRPILSQYCFACHGPDEGSREAGLRLDRADAAFAELESGLRAIVPGKPHDSELVARITARDADMRMPPTTSGHNLSAEQIEILTRWVATGAKYDDHWSFRPIRKPKPPTVGNDAWVRNPIDAFVLARLEQENIAPAPEAAKTTLLRRLSLDLTGLPPQPAEVADFLADDSPAAYERVVERLLASPHFGERWGRHWLDIAHYADSDGYLGDALRPYAWIYRDWVINAVNQDMPFDQFTIEQLAGDLLPNATLAQKTATGFLRNTLRNTEAGVDLEEYRLKEIVDRTSTVGIGWLGLSVGCAECHSHKFDPISHREFYSFFAFFNDADDVNVPVIQPGELETYELRKREWSKDHEKLVATMGEVFRDLKSGNTSIDLKLLRGALATTTKKRSTEQRKLIEAAVNFGGVAQEVCAAYEKLIISEPKKPATAAMTIAARKEPRTSYVHLRGDYRSRGENVVPGTPAVLHPFKPRGRVGDRLDLARWLVRDDNPLTPRVTVNHIWKHLFGRGIVATDENFGSGGEAPSHPDLLDWLASELMARRWSRKEIIRLIVTSATYRQASHTRPELIQRDPLNVLLARQSRFRLEAEAVRDAALAASGLLERKIGGPGIRPPQPAYVASISRNSDWQVSTGPDLYRRGMYILFRRATPYPMLLTFDTPDSTVACTRRERSNSPLQALTLLNDPVFFECAQAFGRQLAAASRNSVDTGIEEGFRRALGRAPNSAELGRVREFVETERLRLLYDPAAAAAMLGQTPNAKRAVATHYSAMTTTAAWIGTARVLMNLDEFITRE